MTETYGTIINVIHDRQERQPLSVSNYDAIFKVWKVPSHNINLSKGKSEAPISAIPYTRIH